MTPDYIETTLPCEVHYDGDGQPTHVVVRAPAGIDVRVEPMDAEDAKIERHDWRNDIELHDLHEEACRRLDARLLDSDMRREEGLA